MTAINSYVMRRAALGEQIIALVANKPLKTSEISEHLGVSRNTIFKILANLTEDDRLHQKRVPTKRGRITLWAVGPDPDPDLQADRERLSVYKPKRPVVQSWALHNVRDSLVAALFGEARHV